MSTPVEMEKPEEPGPGTSPDRSAAPPHDPGSSGDNPVIPAEASESSAETSSIDTPSPGDTSSSIPMAPSVDAPLSSDMVSSSDTSPSVDTPLSSDAASSADTDLLPRPIPAVLPVVEVRDLDWPTVLGAADAPAVRARMRDVVERMETLLDRVGGPGLMFDSDREHAADRAIHVRTPPAPGSLWIIGDLHGDLLALEAALAHIRSEAAADDHAGPRIIFLGDFFDDEGFGLEVVLRVFELIVAAPGSVCVVAGNHDEALSFDGNRFASSVSPSDFADFLNDNRAHEWIERAGKLAVRLTAQATRALFFPDGLLVSHGGFPLADLHSKLAETGNWNDPACLADFVWTRAHPKARRKIPNRFSRGSQFGYEDFGDFCSLSARLGRPVTHMVRGHDHIEERYAIYAAYRTHPVLTTVALSRRLDRERFGPYERAPTLARVVEGALPQVYRLHIPGDIIRGFFPQAAHDSHEPVEAGGEAQT